MAKFPSVVNYEIPAKSDNPFSKHLYEKPLSQTFKGGVNRSGKWMPRKEPAAGWVSERKETGVYLITHGKNNDRVTTSVSLINKAGKIGVTEITPMSFEVRIKDVQNAPVDEDFLFSVSFRPIN